MDVYVDILLLLNIYVNYFLLKATAKFTHTNLKLNRCIFSSIIGSFFALAIFLPPTNAVVSVFIKLFAAVTIITLAFGIKDKEKFIKLILIFFAMNFVFAGVILAIMIFASPPNLQYNNTYFYVDISLFTLIISTVIAYFIINLIRFLLDKKASLNEKYEIVITSGGKTISLNAIPDTGNILTDVFTGQSVIICNKVLLQKSLSICKKLDDTDIYNIPKGFRLLPFSTINSSGILPVFSPDKIYIKSISSNKIKAVNALVGLNAMEDQLSDAIFNPKLLF